RENPRGGEQPPPHEEGVSSEPPEDLAGRHRDEHPDATQREVAGQQMQTDREPEHQGGQPQTFALGDRLPAQTPRERKSPHPPQLCPCARSSPAVTPPLVAEPR